MHHVVGIAIFVLITLASRAEAQAALLADLNPGFGSNNGSSLPQRGVVANGYYYFEANRWDTGRELWRTDGSANGVTLVRDFLPGGDGRPERLATDGTHVAFLARSAAGVAVWRTDGTASGTFPISSFGGGNDFDAGPMFAGNRAVWLQDGSSGIDVWSSDLTTAPPVLLGTFQSFTGLSVGGMAASGNRVYISLGAGGSGIELLSTDGAPAGTVLLDLNPGSNGSVPRSLTADGAGGVWFVAFDPALGRELWHSDGTMAGTSVAADLTPGSGDSTIDWLCALGIRVFFRHGSSTRRLGVSDGTPAGTNLFLGAADPTHIVAVPAFQAVFFAAEDAAAGREPWLSDGTVNGTFRLADIEPGPGDSTSGYDLQAGYGLGQLWFGARTSANGREPYRTDGTTAGTVLVADLATGVDSSDPWFLVALNNNVLLRAYSLTAGHEMFRISSAASPPALIDIYGRAPASSFVTYSPPRRPSAASLNGRVQVVANDGSTGAEPYAAGGEPPMIKALGETNPGFVGWARLLAATTTHTFYEVTVGNARSLHAAPSDGPPVLLSSGAVVGYTVLRDRLVFSQAGPDIEPMISDGTPGGTNLLLDVRSGGSSLASDFATLGGLVYFSCDDGVAGRELWVTDGTPGNTRLAVDLVSGPGSSDPADLVAGDTRIYFTTQSGWHYTDGTLAGTQPIPGLAVSAFAAITVEDLLYAVIGSEVFRSDGTAAGTFRVAQSDSFDPEPIRHLCSARGLAFWSMARQSRSAELWVSDGTLPGTQALFELDPNGANEPPPVTPAGVGLVACARTTPTHGAEVWVSDGTVAGSNLLVDLAPDSMSSQPQFVPGDTTAGGQFVWWGQTPDVGLEPRAVPLTSFGGADFDRVGVGCPGVLGLPHITGVGQPLVGSSQLGYRLENAAASSFTILAIGFTAIPGSKICELHTTADVLVGMFTNTVGRASHTFAVPAASSFQGVRLTGQFLVLDPAGQGLGTLSGTAGMEALIGR